MDDLERYGDYNEVDEAPTKNPVLRLIKAVAVIICFSVIFAVGFRMFTFRYYPANVTSVTFTEPLLAYYEANGGDITVKTQKLRAPYDDAKDGNFFCDYLRVCPEAGFLQITLRFNVSLLSDLAEKYGVTVEDGDTSAFSFRLYKSGEGGEIGTLSYSEWDSFMMYRYAKLVFDGVNFTEADGGNVSWIRLEVFIEGVDADSKKEGIQPFMIPVYENNSEYSRFSEYKLKSSEAPK